MAALAEASFADHAGRRWSAEDFAEILRESKAIGLLARIGGGAETSGDPVGYAVLRTAADEAELLSVGVLEEQRGRGIGRMLLMEAARQAEAMGARKIFLEVSESNRLAVRLYRSMGFTDIGRRANYYRDEAGNAAVAALAMSVLLPLSVGKSV
jgi:ribosomal-protein-alanine N-acetyltransferase